MRKLLLKNIAAVVLCLGLCICAQGQDIVRMWVYTGNGVAVPSGIAVCPDIVLSCAHSYIANAHKIRVYVPSQNKMYTGKLLKVDTAADLCLVQIDPVMKPFKIAEGLTVGENVYWAGYPQSNEDLNLDKRAGVVLQSDSRTVASGGSVYGHSGCPFYNSRLEVVGMVTNTNGEISFGPGLPTIKSWYNLAVRYSKGQQDGAGMRERRTETRKVL